MSSGLECEFTETEPDTWYYLLEQGSAPRERWDWREYADAFGPFPTLDAARTHLAEHQRNPGGHDVVRHGQYVADEAVEAAVAGARANMLSLHGDDYVETLPNGRRVHAERYGVVVDYVVIGAGDREFGRHDMLAAARSVT